MQQWQPQKKQVPRIIHRPLSNLEGSYIIVGRRSAELTIAEVKSSGAEDIPVDKGKYSLPADLPFEPGS